MTRKELNEIKKQFSNENCTISRICGCYVDGEKQIKSTFKEAFLSLEEEERFKYYEIFKKTLSGTPGRNQLTLAFPMSQEMEGGTQEFLYRLLKSDLQNDDLLNQFYSNVIENYVFTGNFLILLIHGAYDVPGKSSDNLEMDDASDEVYKHILCSICPVNLSKPGLSYDAEENIFRNRIQDWIVDAPQSGFLFPAFNDRGSDVHSIQYYTKNTETPNESFVNFFIGCELPLTAETQKESFQALVSDTLGSECEYEVVKNIHEKLTEMIEEHKEKDEPAPLTLNKDEVKKLFAESGVTNERLEIFDRTFDNTIADEKAELLAINIANTRSFEVKTPDVLIKVNPEHAYLVETMTIEGRKCLVIEMGENVEVNGITVS
ncbi:MAG: DUF4317 domain-containing protein [Lachnospiraceae bacterium]|nr:DUF4317 domain-containing protein [Lachnospiraceae bacterium]